MKCGAVNDICITTLITTTIKNIDMINNTIKTAKFKLSQHKVQGVKSALTVFEVARLMDTIKIGESMKDNQSSNVFFSLN